MLFVRTCCSYVRATVTTTLNQTKKCSRLLHLLVICFDYNLFGSFITLFVLYENEFSFFNNDNNIQYYTTLHDIMLRNNTSFSIEIIQFVDYYNNNNK